MLDDFFGRAILVGIAIALVAGPLGCFIVWRRLAYFGDSLSHSALLGVVLGLLLEINLTAAIFVVCVLVSVILLSLQNRTNIPSDALLGIISHGTLAVGLATLAFMSWIRLDLMGLLFGDILAVSKTDVLITFSAAAVLLLILVWIWKPLFAATINPELAAAEGVQIKKANMIFTLMTASIIALSMKIVGVLLITAMLIIPAATARRFAVSPEVMAILSALLGVASVVLGLMGSLEWNTPSGPSIVIAATLLFTLGLSPLGHLLSKHRRQSSGGKVE